MADNAGLRITICDSFLLLIVGAVYCGFSLFCSTLSADDRPNVIVIMTDEHNFRTLGCYRETMEKRQAYMWGPSVVETPHIDWIARNGAICTSFYATTPVCSPSRACLISGLYPQATPVVTNNIPLADGIVTFAEILGKQGYATGFAGKWHLDGTGKPQWAPQRKFGFDDNRYMFVPIGTIPQMIRQSCYDGCHAEHSFSRTRCRPFSAPVSINLPFGSLPTKRFQVISELSDAKT